MRNNSDFDLFYQTVNKEYFKAICIETTDAVYNALKERFEQPSFIIFSTLEQLLLKLLNGETTRRSMAILCWSMRIMLKQQRYPVSS